MLLWEFLPCPFPLSSGTAVASAVTTQLQYLRGDLHQWKCTILHSVVLKLKSNDTPSDILNIVLWGKGEISLIPFKENNKI